MVFNIILIFNFHNYFLVLFNDYVTNFYFIDLTYLLI